jgi:Major capsid protein 13-like
MPTKISDVIVPEVFNPYVIQETTRLDAFILSGIVANDPALNALASQGGTLINMPYWDDLSGDSEELSDGTALTVGKITAGKDVARLHMRGKAWGVNDLAKALSGDDPLQVIGSKVAKFWVGERQKILIKSLKGIFASSNMDTNKYDISAAAGAASNITAVETLNAKQKMGDNADKLTAIAMHSAVFTYLQQQDLIDTVVPSDGGEPFQTYLTYRVIVDDGLVDTAGVYETYLFGQSAFGLGNGEAPVPTENDRDSLAGEDVLINRQHFLLHPRGVKWTETTCAGATPTFTEIATAGNWTRVYDPKNVRIVLFKHKINVA